MSLISDTNEILFMLLLQVSEHEISTRKIQHCTNCVLIVLLIP